MSLVSWQLAVVDMVNGRSAVGASAGLDERERAWITAAGEHEGTAVTRDVALSWRTQRLAAIVPLTLLVLHSCKLLDLVRGRYLATTDPPSSYPQAEARQFLDHVTDQVLSRIEGGDAPDHPHLSTVVELERAVLAARASVWTTTIRASHPDDVLLPGVGCLVRARCDAGGLLRGLLAGTDLPERGSGHGAFLVAPGIAGCFREATVAEIRALTLVGAGCPASEVAGHWPNDLVDPVVLARLESVGALLRQPPPRVAEPRRGGSLLVRGRS